MNLILKRLNFMFRKLFKRKHLSDSVTSNNEMTIKSKPIIYFSTDKGKYVCANVPDNMNVISNIEYSEADYKGCKNISTKSYPQHNRYDTRQLKKDDYKYMDEIYDSYMADIDSIHDTYSSYIDDSSYIDESSYIDDSSYTVSNVDEVQNNIVNPSKNLNSTNLDYISKNFLFDENDGIYYFKRNDNDSLSYNELLSYNDSIYSNL